MNPDFVCPQRKRLLGRSGQRLREGIGGGLHFFRPKAIQYLFDYLFFPLCVGCGREYFKTEYDMGSVGNNFGFRPISIQYPEKNKLVTKGVYLLNPEIAQKNAIALRWFNLTLIVPYNQFQIGSQINGWFGKIFNIHLRWRRGAGTEVGRASI